jgi:hypothetical protein
MLARTPSPERGATMAMLGLSQDPHVALLHWSKTVVDQLCQGKLLVSLCGGEPAGSGPMSHFTPIFKSEGLAIRPALTASQAECGGFDPNRPIQYSPPPIRQPPG